MTATGTRADVPDPGAGLEESSNESTVTVLVALGANLLIAIAKSVAALLTGSASMVAESAHSWADTGNEVFLIIAGKRATKPATPRHPLGFGRDTYVWSLFAAVGLFTVGALVSIQHGISELGQHGPAEEPVVNYVVLAISFVLEGVSFVRGFRQVRRSAAGRQQDVLDYTVKSSDPTVRAVVFEDAAALIGVLIAAAGVLLHQLTGEAVYDAVGSIVIGVVLAVAAVVLVELNRRFLIGEAVDPAVRRAALTMLTEHEQITRVSYLHLEYIGPGQVFLVAAVDLAGDAPEHSVALRLRELSDELESRPHVRRAILTLTAPGDPDAVP
jgi:cation diffusion facilitator family transporter